MRIYFPNTLLRIIETIHPASAEKKAECLRLCDAGKAYSLAALITSIALAIIGAACCIMGKYLFGIPLVLFSLPLCYFSYNFYHTFEKSKDFCQNPLNYVLTNGLHFSPNLNEIKNRLKFNTIYFGWLIDYLIARIRRKKTN